MRDILLSTIQIWPGFLRKRIWMVFNKQEILNACRLCNVEDVGDLQRENYEKEKWGIPLMTTKRCGCLFTSIMLEKVECLRAGIKGHRQIGACGLEDLVFPRILRKVFCLSRLPILHVTWFYLFFFFLQTIASSKYGTLRLFPKVKLS